MTVQDYEDSPEKLLDNAIAFLLSTWPDLLGSILKE